MCDRRPEFVTGEPKMLQTYGECDKIINHCFGRFCNKVIVSNSFFVAFVWWIRKIAVPLRRKYGCTHLGVVVINNQAFAI